MKSTSWNWSTGVAILICKEAELETGSYHLDHRKRFGANENMKAPMYFDFMFIVGSCNVYVGFVRPGRKSVEVICPSEGKHITATIHRNGEMQGWPSSTPEKINTTAEQDIKASEMKTEQEKLSWEGTSIGAERSPTAEIVFKCVDSRTSVVVGAAMEKREGRPDGMLCVPASPSKEDNESSAVTSAGGGVITLEVQNSAKLAELESAIPSGFTNTKQGRAGSDVVSTAVECGIPTASKNGNDADDGDDRQSIPSALQRSTQLTKPIAEASRKSDIMLDTAARPQVCVPLEGTGYSGCIGIIGVQGFSTGRVVDDDEWRDWFALRTKPLERDQNRAVKRLKLVRPRELPTRGKLQNVPSGTAAKVVYGTVERIKRKRRGPAYSVRLERREGRRGDGGLSNVCVVHRLFFQVREIVKLRLQLL